MVADGTGGTEDYLCTHATTVYVEDTYLDITDVDVPYIVDRVATTIIYEVPDDGGLTARATTDVIGQALNYYDGDPFVGEDLGELGERGLLSRSETLAMTDAMLAAAYPDNSQEPDVGPPIWLTDDSPSWTSEYPTAFRSNVSQRGAYVIHASVTGVTDGYYVISAANEYDGDLGLLVETRDPIAAYEDRDGTRVTYDDYDLLVASVTDPLDLLTTATHDYRVFQPIAVQDPNENHTQFAFDDLGFLVAVAVLGKYDGGEDEYEGDEPDEPSITYSYDFDTFDVTGDPVSVTTVRRTHHHHDPDDTGETLKTVEFSDGFGRLVQTRTLAEDTIYGDDEELHVQGASGLSPDMTLSSTAALALTRDSEDPDHVVVSGWTVFDNKGNVVEKYEPFFDTEWDFTDRDTQPDGLQSVLMRYDARGRNVETTYSDGSQERVVFGIPTALDDPDDFESTPWESYAYGRNDLGALTHDPGETWSYADHYWTPASMTVDALGRVVSSIARNHQSDTDEWFETKTSYDIRGNVLTVTDPLDRVAATQVYDLLNRSLRTESIDAGDSIIVYDAASLPRETRDGKGALILSGYDDALRQTHLWARDDDNLAMGLRVHTVYGDAAGLGSPEDDNLNGKPHLQYDEAGRLTFASYDFKGNLLHKERTVIDPLLLVTAADSGTSGNSWTYTPHRTDWDAGETLSQREAALLDGTDYETTTTYDALNRPKSIQLPEDQENDRRIIRPTYNRAGALESVAVEDDAPSTTTYVDRIAYNARGQRLFVALGNGVMTRYAYDPDTFRLARMRSIEYAESSGTYSEDGSKFQDNGYHYDLAGNILSIFDKSDIGAQIDSAMPGSIASYPFGVPQTVTFWRQYAYDPLSRLTSATGASYDARAVTDPWENYTNYEIDVNYVTPFFEEYEYDANSNLTQLVHEFPEFTTPLRYRRNYDVESGSNRLETMNIAETPHSSYLYDAAGNMVKENTNRQMTWDFADRMHTYRTQVDAQPASVFAHYLYDAGGERVMKVVSKAGTDDVVGIYIDGIYEHREHRTSGGDDINDELHITDGAARIARLRVGDAFDDDSSPDVIYVLGDHLGSSTFTLEDDGSFFSREEYTPYGESAFGSYLKKRYRFTAKEKDEESGLHYHSARYYAPWLGRWTATDSLGMVDGPNFYAYAKGNPNTFTDRGGCQTASLNSASEAVGVARTTVEESAIRSRHLSLPKDVVVAEESGSDVLERTVGKEGLRDIATHQFEQGLPPGHSGRRATTEEVETTSKVKITSASWYRQRENKEMRGDATYVPQDDMIVVKDEVYQKIVNGESLSEKEQIDLLHEYAHAVQTERDLQDYGRVAVLDSERDPDGRPSVSRAEQLSRIEQLKAATVSKDEYVEQALDREYDAELASQRTVAYHGAPDAFTTSAEWRAATESLAQNNAKAIRQHPDYPRTYGSAYEKARTAFQSGETKWHAQMRRNGVGR